MKRREAREIVLSLIYESAFAAEGEQVDPERMIQLASERRDFEADEYIRSALKGVLEHQAEIDRRIEENIVGWKLERLSRMSQAIIRLAIYEMLYRDDVPMHVAINEAVELAKKYDHDKAPAFVNGLLNSVAVKEGLKETEPAK